MSDLQNEPNVQPVDEPTKQVQVMEVPVQRHRRSRNSRPTEAESQTVREVPPAQIAYPAPQQRASTPRPQALQRVTQDQAQKSENSRNIRRPVQESGYSQRRPLGTAGENESTPARPPLGPRGVRNPSEEEEAPKRGISRILLIILIVLLIIGLLVLGLHLIPENAQGFLGDVKRTVSSTLGRSAAPTEEPVPQVTIGAYQFRSDTVSGYAPAEVTFTLSSGSQFEDARLLDMDGRVVDSYVFRSEQDDGSVQWSLIATFENAYFGPVTAQLLAEGVWQDTGEEIPISIQEQTVRETSTEPPVSEAPAAVAMLVNDFSGSPSQGTAPVNVAFSMTTSLSVTNVRLVDDMDQPLEAESLVLVDNTNTRVWALNYTFDEGYNGVIYAQILNNGEWVNSGKTCTLQIKEPLEPVLTPAPVETVVPVVEAAVTEDADAYDLVPEYTEDAVDETAEPEPTLRPEAQGFALPMEVSPTPAPEGAEATDVVDEAAVDADPDAVTADADWTEPAVDAAEETAALEAAVVAEAEPTEEAEPTPVPRLTAEAAESADPSLIKTSVIYNGTKKVSSYDRSAGDILDMPAADAYARQPYGVMTFRGSSFRQNAAEGTVPSLSSMEVLWRANASSVRGSGSTYYGIGWTGQPLIIKWSKEVRELSNILDEKKNTKALREVIVAGEDGNIYFLDLETGEPTRDVIELGYPMRGTPSVHSMGYPVMSVGQYARKMAKKTGDIGMRVYNLLTQKQSFMLDGLDGKLDRPYYSVGSFETSSLFDYNSDSMVSIGTNGMLYVTKLNTDIDRNSGTMTVKPDTVSLKTKASGESDKQVAVESSMAAYQQYVFYADMGGYLRCVDTSSMTTVWAVDTGDSVEAAIALDLDEQGQLWLYTANTLQQRKKGDCHIRCYNAMTGEMRWEYAVTVDKASKKNGNVIGGFRASPVVGTGMLKDMVFFTASSVTSVGSSASPSMVFALDKESGEVMWTKRLDVYTYASPVAVYTEDGQAFLIQPDSSGILHLLDGMSGSEVSSLQLEGTINASPAVYKDTLVIGTQGKDTSYIYGISLK